VTITTEIWNDARKQLLQAVDGMGGAVRFIAWNGEEREYRLAVKMQAWKLGLCVAYETTQHGRYKIRITSRHNAIPRFKSGTRGRGKKKAADKRRRLRAFDAVATYSKRQRMQLGRAPVDVIMMVPKMRANRGAKGKRYKPDARTRAEIASAKVAR